MLRAMKPFAIVTIATVFAVGLSPISVGAANDWYTYPVRPGDSKWRELTTFAAMQEACRIPEPVLQQLTTQQLAEVCVDYPLIGNMFAYPSDRAIDTVADGFNGLESLLRREDVGLAVARCYGGTVARYIAADSTPDRDSSNRYRCPEWLKVYFVEALLGHDKVLAQIDDETATEILRTARIKYRFLEESVDRDANLQSMSARSCGALVLRTIDALGEDSNLARKLGAAEALRTINTNDRDSSGPSPADVARLMDAVGVVLER